MKTLHKHLIILLFLCLTLLLSGQAMLSYALDGEVRESYIVYNENDEIICEKSAVEVGDSFITSDFCEYEIIELDSHKAKAKLVRKLEAPRIYEEENVAKKKMAARGNLAKKICLYMTHNDESYTPSDGYDSIYGAGGIHDVAKAFKRELSEKGVEVVLDETLHIPHNSSAYSRSSVTANRLLSNERPDAMFDVHRDGVSKSYYYVTNDGKPYSKIRIVLGKANPNFDENYKFATTIFTLGNSKYPFLFSDIYLGKGHYNQALQPTDLLFEMGTYLIEKEYVLSSLPLLAEVVDTALYGSQVDDNGDITIDKEVVDNNSFGSVLDTTDKVKPAVKQKSSKGYIAPLVISIVVIAILGAGAILLLRRNKKQ